MKIEVKGINRLIPNFILIKKASENNFKLKNPTSSLNPEYFQNIIKKSLIKHRENGKIYKTYEKPKSNILKYRKSDKIFEKYSELVRGNSIGGKNLKNEKNKLSTSKSSNLKLMIYNSNPERNKFRTSQIKIRGVKLDEKRLKIMFQRPKFFSNSPKF